MGGWGGTETAWEARSPIALCLVQESVCVWSAVGLHVAGLSGRVRVCVRPVSSVRVSVCVLAQPCRGVEGLLLWGAGGG